MQEDDEAQVISVKTETVKTESEKCWGLEDENKENDPWKHIEKL